MDNLEIPDAEYQKFVKDTAGLNPKERAVKLREFATTHLPNVAFEQDDNQRMANAQVHLKLSDEQLKMLIERSVGGARQAIEEITEGVKAKNLAPNDAEARITAEMTVEQHVRNEATKEKRHGIIADVFTNMYRQKAGLGGNLMDAYKREAEYLGRDTLATRAMTEGTGADGGYMVPELFLQEVYIGLAKTSLARRLTTIITVNADQGAGAIKLPKITTGVTGRKLAEVTAATVDQPTFGQLELDPQKIVVMTKPFSHEIFVKTRPEIVPVLTQLAIIALARKEDEIFLVGSDSGFDGLLENTTNTVILGGSSSSGMDAITDLTFEDLADLENAIGDHYIPDEDVGHAMNFTGQAGYFVNKKVTNVLSKLKGNDDYYWKRMEAGKNRMIHGHPYWRSPDLPSAPAANTAFAAFGNPKFYYMAIMNKLYVDLFTSGTVDSVNLATEGAMSMRFIEYVDGDLVDDNATAILKTSTT